MKNNHKAQRNFVLRIPNNEEGNAFYKQLKGYLNTNSWAMDRKASGNRTRPEYRNSFNTTMGEAESIRVYLAAKTPDGNVQVTHTETRYALPQGQHGGGEVMIAPPRKKFLGIL